MKVKGIWKKVFDSNKIRIIVKNEQMDLNTNQYLILKNKEAIA
jgi:hypothetical protein